VGYGNPHRKDDGIGPYVVEKVSRDLGAGTGVALRSMHQLDPALAEEVHGAETLILVDATVEPLECGLRWARIEPVRGLELRDTHNFQPPLFAWLLESLYGRSPVMWLVSVQGNDFGFGEGLSIEAWEMAERACREK
jgi:hydrogenase maturation protease